MSLKNVFTCLTSAVFYALYFFSEQAWSVSSTEAIDLSIHQPYVHSRALGMGNAFTAVSDDYAAMFYNPAGLARLETWQINAEVRAMLDSKILKLVQDIKKASDKYKGKSSSSSSSSANSQSLQEMQTLLESRYGHYSMRLPTAGAFWVWPNWGLAAIPLDLDVELELQRLAGPGASVIATQDSTFAIGYARSPKWFGAHNFSLGMTLKGIYRAYFNRSLLALDLAQDSNFMKAEYAAEGMTVDADLGMLFSPSVESGFWRWARNLRPTFGFAVRNAVDYGFTSNLHIIHKKSTQPPKLQRRFDVGTMWELPDWWIFKTRFAADLHDIGHKNFTLGKGTHLGFEFLWKVFGWWRGGWRVGLNQGYFTAGFTGKLGVFQLDLATYAEEVGSSQAHVASRRYMAQASLDF